MAVQTVTPLPKPGTELTAYALPTPDGATRTTAAALAVETAMMNKPGEKTASPSVASETKTPSQVASTASIVASEIQQTSKTLSIEKPALPTAASALVSAGADRPAPTQGNLLIMAAMESDFDTGEPVGLETLVAKRMIVPVPRPSITAAAYAIATAIPDTLGLIAKPTSSRPELDRLITFYAKLNKIPEELVHRVVKRESTYNPRAYHAGNYGLMQIRYNTARSLGYDGPAEGLFDAETNLKYATKYLAGAWMVADNKNDGAVKLYASGYYNDAKRKGLLDTLDMR